MTNFKRGDKIRITKGVFEGGTTVVTDVIPDYDERGDLVLANHPFGTACQIQVPASRCELI